ncbi:P2Y purinoceptor 14-like [Oreochromis aureus]|uniref:P2Y purinoceptor 14-like n=1 Tax=Oreochromis aureus TaxID=47969 RepID=UPI00195450ED|nr:P2Y purinoceptor 14-like [Oreochromis aureus]CAI5669796.1 unnamed protein product [Mustela putorius furo]
MGSTSINRYLRIIHPSGTHMLRTVQTARIISVITWVSLLAPTVVYVIIFFSSQEPLTFNPSRCVHLFTPSVSLLFRILHIFSAINFLLFFISLVFFYYSIFRRVLEAQQKQLTSSGSEKLVKYRRNVLVLEVTTMVSVFNICLDPVVYFFLSNTFGEKVRAKHPTTNEENKSSKDKLDIITLEQVTRTS